MENSCTAHTPFTMWLRDTSRMKTIPYYEQFTRPLSNKHFQSSHFSSLVCKVLGAPDKIRHQGPGLLLGTLLSDKPDHRMSGGVKM